MFNNIAQHYDRANAILSFNLHKNWNKKLVNKTILDQPHQYLDLCCGTGDIALQYLTSMTSPCNARLVDFSENMLEIAQKKTRASLFDKAYCQLHEGRCSTNLSP